MITLKTMEQLYNLSTENKLEKLKEVYEERKKALNSYMQEIKTVKHYLEAYVDYNDVLNGKVEAVPENATIFIPHYEIVNIKLRNYCILFNAVKKIEQEIAFTKRAILPKQVYDFIIKFFNARVCRSIVLNKKAFYHPYLGSIHYAPSQPRVVVDWGKSNKAKAAIIRRGGIPYSKREENEALARGHKYLGEKWIINVVSSYKNSLHWRKPSVIGNKENALLKLNKVNFKYKPARGQSGILSLIPFREEDNLGNSLIPIES